MSGDGDFYHQNMLLYIIKVSVLEKPRGEKPRGQLSTFCNLETKYYNHILENLVKDKKIKLNVNQLA